MKKIKNLFFAALAILLLTGILLPTSVYADEQESRSPASFIPEDELDNDYPAVLRGPVLVGSTYFEVTGMERNTPGRWFQVAGGNWEFRNLANQVVRGWISYRGQWYFTDRVTGLMQRGWIEYSARNWYFLNPLPGRSGHTSALPDGAMRTGWVTYNGDFYFLNPREGAPNRSNSRPEGVMLTGWRNISGEYFFLNPFRSQDNHDSRIVSGAAFTSRVNGGRFIIGSFMEEFNIMGVWQHTLFQVAPAPPQPTLAITQQPQSITRRVGEDATFTIGVNRTDVSFRWDWWNPTTGQFQPVMAHGGASGITSRTLTQANVTLSPMNMNGWRYRVVVTDSQGRSINSNTVTLTVTSGGGGNNPIPPITPVATRFIRPMARGGITSHFGVPRGTRTHRGVDIASGGGREPIVAIAPGIVTAVHSGCIEAADEHDHVNINCGMTFGNYVTIRHNLNGTIYYTLSAHLRYNPLVSAGDEVIEGQQIGVEGNTGSSRGAHLHFELHRHRFAYNADNGNTTIDPAVRLSLPDSWTAQGSTRLVASRPYEEIERLSLNRLLQEADTDSLDERLFGSWYFENPNHATISLNSDGTFSFGESLTGIWSVVADELFLLTPLNITIYRFRFTENGLTLTSEVTPGGYSHVQNLIKSID